MSLVPSAPTLCPSQGTLPSPHPKKDTLWGQKGFIWGDTFTKTPEDTRRGCVSLEGSHVGVEAVHVLLQSLQPGIDLSQLS